MKLIIFGSTGGTGRQLIAQALQQKHQVTAFARNPDKLIQTHPNLNVIKGDVLDPGAVQRAIQGQEVVLCSLGMPNIMDRSKLRTKGTKNIVDAMLKSSVTRLICQSGLGAGDSRDLLPFHYKYVIAPLFMRALYADHNKQEEIITESTLEWTIVRPGSLTNGDLTASYHQGYNIKNKPDTIKISRADTADFMLKQLNNTQYLHRTPCLSY